MVQLQARGHSISLDYRVAPKLLRIQSRHCNPHTCMNVGMSSEQNSPPPKNCTAYLCYIHHALRYFISLHFFECKSTSLNRFLALCSDLRLLTLNSAPYHSLSQAALASFTPPSVCDSRSVYVCSVPTCPLDCDFHEGKDRVCVIHSLMPSTWHRMNSPETFLDRF